MKLSLTFMALLLIGGFLTASTKEASAVVYCQYVDYPANCTVRAGVVLRPRPIAREAVRPGEPGNRGGPVDRAGRR
jgi:hypothetical protein